MKICRQKSSISLPCSYKSDPTPARTIHGSFALLLRRLGSLLPITLDHNHTQKASHHCSAQQQQNDRYANRPDARWKELLDGMGVVYEGLLTSVSGVVTGGVGG